MSYERGKMAALAAMGIKDTDKVQKKIRYAGMPIHLDQPKGSKREWHDSKGNLIYSHIYPEHYGFFPQVLGADGDHLDAYVGPHKPSDAPTVYVVDKMKKDGTTFDEHKLFVGFKDQSEVKQITDGWQHQSQVGPTRTMSLQDLKAQVSKGKFTPPK